VKKILLVSALMLAMVAPAFAATEVLVNRDFENGLTGWWLRDGRQAITSLPQATPLLPLAEHPNQTWLGSEQPWAQVVDSTTTKLDIIEGYNSTTDPLFRDRGDDVTTPAPYGGTKAAGWARGGYMGIGGETHTSSTTMWDGRSYISQYVQLKPGTWNLTASAMLRGDGADSATVKGAATAHLEIFGDPGDADYWHVDWYGDDEGDGFGGVPGRIRDSSWLQNLTPAWIASTASGSVTTHTGWVEVRLSYQEVEANSKGSGDRNITDGEYAVDAYWLMVDDMSLLVPDEAIPEPSSIVALLTGLVGLGGLALRRRR